MTVSQFIDYKNIDPTRVKSLAKFNGIKLEKPVLTLKLDKAYQLAQIMNVDAIELVLEMFSTEYPNKHIIV
jgi:hypothetical protein